MDIPCPASSEAEERNLLDFIEELLQGLDEGDL